MKNVKVQYETPEIKVHLVNVDIVTLSLNTTPDNRVDGPVIGGDE